MRGQKFIPLLIVAAALLAYHNSFTGSFLYDDMDSVVENTTISQLWPIWKTLSPPSSAGVGGRPVVNLSFAINYAFGGLNPRGYHALNLAIHILAGLTLFGVVRRSLARTVGTRFIAADGRAPSTLLRAGRAQPYQRQALVGTQSTASMAAPLRLCSGQAERSPTERMAPLERGPTTFLALAIAILWIVHPLQTEAVTYVTQRAESLMGLFYLLTLYCFIRGVDVVGTHSSASMAAPLRRCSGQAQRGPTGAAVWFALSVAACLLGMGSKEVMVTAPVMVLLYDRTFVAGSFREAIRQRWLLYAGLAATWLPLGYLMTSLHDRGVGYGLEVTWWKYGLSECWAVARYLRLAVWPHPLIFDYGRETIISSPTVAAPYALVLLLLVVATVLALKWRPALGFVGAWFFMILAPSSSVVPVANQAVAENRMYLPLAAVVVLVALGLHAVLGRRSIVAFLAMAVGLGFLTVHRNGDYRTDLAIWGDTVARRPGNARAQFNYGNALLDAGKTEEAIARYEQALQISPYFAGAHNSLGIALAQSGRIQEAIEHFAIAVQLNPGFADAHYNLAMALGQVGNMEGAIEQWKEMVRLRPNDPGGHNNLGIGLSQTGKIPEAVEQFEQAVRLNPNWAEAHYNLGTALIQQGRVPEAIEHYEQAVRLNPSFAPAQEGLARLRAR